ncbi:MAG: hybrid sensor histidine kinase/response regulator, partial [bacterium]|nr:hybrid sensor histidine kinase/response regulator [bacterium]
RVSNVMLLTKERRKIHHISYDYCRLMLPIIPCGLAPGWLIFGRAWAAGIFSTLIITPFMFTWYSLKNTIYKRHQAYEIATGFLVLTIVVHVLFWTAYPASFGIIAVFILPAVLIWFALNMETKWTTLALILTSIFGFAGSIIARPTPIALNEQLLASQLYFGLIAGIFLVFSAVVEERKVAYKSLKRVYDSSLSSDKSKGEFIAILAHELRNPLASIVSSTELLELRSNNTDSEKVIESIKANSKTMTRMLDDLLDTVRLSENKFKLQKETTSLKEIMEQAVESKKNLLEKYNHNLSVVLPENDVTVFADPVRIKQIIINLVGNACKYTKPGGNIGLSALVLDEWIVIRVTDNGVGMDEDTISYIFEPFKQSEFALKQDRSGLGIGLFLTKELTEMHGGRIEAKSGGLGKGSTFSVYLPILAKDLQEVPSSVEDSNQNRPKNKQRVFRIMLVDDNQDIVNALQELLGYHGHEVAVFYTGTTALQNFDIFKPEVVFLDIRMPEIGGHEVAKELRRRGWQGKIIALSGYGQSADLIESQNAGFDNHLVKPIGIEKILSVLRSI